MPILTRVKPSEYHDSITLMQVAAALLDMPGVQDAAVVMGTPANHEILAGAGLLTPEAAASQPDDLVIVVAAADQAAAEDALARAEQILSQRALQQAEAGQPRPKSLASAVRHAPEANLAVISVAGRYAAAEARTALQHGLHVLLFSDNVPLEEEIALKRLAVERGLLCMGPDAGTAIINGVALGFANKVPRGNVGLVSAAGTGLQGVTCGLARRGAGVSQAIGVGGRDLSEAVGGAMMLQGLRALQEDPETAVIVLISKPPARAVAEKILSALGGWKPQLPLPSRPTATAQPTQVGFATVAATSSRPAPDPTPDPAPGPTADQPTQVGFATVAATSSRPAPDPTPGPAPDPAPDPTSGRPPLPKPTVVCFLGADPGPIERAGAIPATNLTQAAAIAAALATGANWCEALVKLEEESKALITLAAAQQAKLAAGQRALRGLFAGGTFCYEAQVILRNLPEPIYSNAPLDKDNKLETRFLGETGFPGHYCIDLGEDEFTQGRPHPMIDPSLRNRRIVQEARDPATAVILLDVVLGYGAHPDPAGATVPAIREAQRIAAEAGRQIIFIASVCGTEGDPQVLSRQEAVLREAGVIVLPDNASAARLAGLITQALHE